VASVARAVMIKLSRFRTGGIIPQKIEKFTIPINIAKIRRDILRDCMHKSQTRLVLFGTLIALTVAVALTVSAPSGSFGNASHAAASAALQETTPTPTQTPASEAGSTDGIMWMGVAIIVIILLPILTRRATWH
jgi:hypothetical protein